MSGRKRRAKENMNNDKEQGVEKVNPWALWRKNVQEPHAQELGKI